MLLFCFYVWFYGFYDSLHAVFSQLTAIDVIHSGLRDSRRYSGLMKVFEIFDNFHPQDNSYTRAAFSITSSGMHICIT